MARRVLIVDDEVPPGEYLADALHAVGYEVEVVGTGFAGITAARARRPDVIFARSRPAGGTPRTSDAAAAPLRSRDHHYWPGR